MLLVVEEHSCEQVMLSRSLRGEVVVLTGAERKESRR